MYTKLGLNRSNAASRPNPAKMILGTSPKAITTAQSYRKPRLLPLFSDCDTYPCRFPTALYPHQESKGNIASLSIPKDDAYGTARAAITIGGEDISPLINCWD